MRRGLARVGRPPRPRHAPTPARRRRPARPHRPRSRPAPGRSARHPGASAAVASTSPSTRTASIIDAHRRRPGVRGAGSITSRPASTPTSVQVGIGEQRADERQVGDAAVAHGDADLPAHLGTGADVDVGSRHGAVRGPHRGRRVADRRSPPAPPRAPRAPRPSGRAPRARPGSPRAREHDERQHERELHRRLAAIAPRPACVGLPAPHAGRPTADCSSGQDLADHGVEQLARSSGVPVAQVMSSVASATAPRITSAYSAVDWPASSDTRPERTRTCDDTLGHVTASSARSDGCGEGECGRGDASEPCQAGGEARDHGEQHERGQHEEDQGEEQPHRDAASVRLGAPPERGAVLGGEPGQRLARPVRRAGRTASSASATGRSAGVDRATASCSASAKPTPSAHARSTPPSARRRPGGAQRAGDLDREVRRAPGVDRDAEEIERDRQLARQRAPRPAARRRRPRDVGDDPADRAVGTRADDRAGAGRDAAPIG